MIIKSTFSIFLLIIASIVISFGGLIMRNISHADAWQIIFFRSLSFVIIMSIILCQQYKKSTFIKIKKIGYVGIVGGFFLMLAHIFYVHSFANTSIGNTLFTLSSIPFITAILAFVFLKEKIELRKIIIMLFGLFGIVIMIYDGLGTGGIYGNIMALFCATSFSFYTLIMRKYRKTDMIPTLLVSGILLSLVTFIINFNDLIIPIIDILLCFLWGGILSAFVNIIFIYATRYLSASEVTFFMLLEFALGPFWVWMFLNESISKNTFLGGIIVMVSVGVYSFIEVYNSKLKIKNSQIHLE